ncbi:MAG: MMPL family transporter [Acidobacteriota bacterium]|nr:MMPL family transporter [Acidobacteriota bacterium]
MKLKPYKLATWVAEHPVVSLTLLFVLVAGMLGRITHLEIDSSTTGMMDEKDPKKPIYEEYKEIFGSDILTVIVIERPEGAGDVFNPKTLELVQTLTDELFDWEGVTSVSSMTTVNNIRGEGDYINTDPLVDFIPEDPEELAVIRRNALETPAYPGNIVSADGRFAAINIYTETGGDKKYDSRFQEKLKALMQEHGGNHKLYQVGGPRFNTHFNNSIERDQMTLVPAAVVVILIILLLVFRIPVAVSLPVVTGGLSIAATVGFMAWMGYSVGPVSVMIPSILIVVGCTEDVHLISEYYQHLRDGLTVRQAIIETMHHGSLAITLTSITTMLGFGALSLNDITSLKEFGIIAFFGLFANFLVTITVVPAMLRLSKKPPPKDRGLSKVIAGTLHTVVYINLHHRVKTGIAAGFVLTMAVLGCLRLEVNNDPISFFQKSSDIRQDFERIHTDLAGAQAFNILFETAEEGDVKEPDVLQTIDDVQAHLESMGLFDKTISLADFVKTMHREMKNDPNQFAIPESRGAIAEYLLLLENDELFRYVDSNNQYLSIAVRHNMSGSADVRKALAQIDAFIQQNAANYVKDGEIYPLKYAITGESILLHSATDAMIAGQVKSLALALLTILVIISLLFMSLQAGLVALSSNLIPILLNFGLMGWIGIPFNTGTCLVATIALGIAVDDTIHFMVRYQKELRLTNSQEKAMAAAIRTEGNAIATTSLALSLGFLVMSLSQFQPSVHMGFLSALVMIYALMTDLFINPVLLLTIQLITLWDFIGLKLREETMRESLIFKGLSISEIKKVILLGSLRKVDRDQMVLREGEPGEEMYVILSGYVRIFLEKNRDQTIAVMEEGDVLGEMAMLGEGFRTASAEALYDLELLRIDAHALDRVTRREPRIAAKLYANISRVLIERVRETTQTAVHETELQRLHRMFGKGGSAEAR